MDILNDRFNQMTNNWPSETELRHQIQILETRLSYIKSKKTGNLNRTKAISFLIGMLIYFSGLLTLVFGVILVIGFLTPFLLHSILIVGLFLTIFGFTLLFVFPVKLVHYIEKHLNSQVIP